MKEESGWLFRTHPAGAGDMCANCGFPAAPGHWTEAGNTSTPDRLRSRYRRARILQSILPSYGLIAYDGGLIPGIQIGTLSGGETIAADLDELWVTAERLSGAPIDPLDPRFLDEEKS